MLYTLSVLYVSYISIKLEEKKLIKQGRKEPYHALITWLIMH